MDTQTHNTTFAILIPATEPTSYVFDGTFFGLLTAIFESYERKQKSVRLCVDNGFSEDMFGGYVRIETTKEKAMRVWKGLNKKLKAVHQQQFYTSWYADDLKTWQMMFDYALYIFDHPKGYDENYGSPLVLGLNDMAKKVSRERHRMKAFIRFQKGANHLFHAVVNPDFNVLPLIAGHFERRYADQHWVIYDERRRYGLYYNLKQVQEVSFDNTQTTNAVSVQEDVTLDGQEELYATLWKDYFKNTNIKERKNLKLHIQHVPKRYWRYLTEKEISR